METCVDSNSYYSIVNSELNEGKRIFNVTGTPGNVIVNNET
jgi:hypothetical protein